MSFILERISLLYQGVNSLISAVEQSLVLYLDASMILDEKFSIGMLLAFLAYKSQLLQRASELLERVINLRLLKLQGERLADIVLAEPEPPFRKRDALDHAPHRARRLISGLCAQHLIGAAGALNSRYQPL